MLFLKLWEFAEKWAFILPRLGLFICKRSFMVVVQHFIRINIFPSEGSIYVMSFLRFCLHVNATNCDRGSCSFKRVTVYCHNFTVRVIVDQYKFKITIIVGRK